MNKQKRQLIADLSRLSIGPAPTMADASDWEVPCSGRRCPHSRPSQPALHPTSLWAKVKNSPAGSASYEIAKHAAQHWASFHLRRTQSWRWKSANAEPFSPDPWFWSFLKSRSNHVLWALKSLGLNPTCRASYMHTRAWQVWRKQGHERTLAEIRPLPIVPEPQLNKEERVAPF